MAAAIKIGCDTRYLCLDICNDAPCRKIIVREGDTLVYDLDVTPWYANGEYAVNIEVLDASDADAEDFNIGAISGKVIIDNEYEAGDVTLDGEVTTADLIAIARYLVCPDIY